MQKLKFSREQIKRARVGSEAHAWKRAPKPINREWKQPARISRIVWQY